MTSLKLQERPGLLFSTVFIGFLGLSYLVGIGPALTSQRNSMAGKDAASHLDATGKRGRSTYVEEGCAYCHTQQVRPISMDAPWGRPTTPKDYADLEPLSWYSGTPGLLGSQRSGPDLSNVGARQPSEEWHLLHLYNPRLVVADSIMPAMPWLFRTKGKPQGGERWVQLPAANGKPAKKVIATTKARELVSYLLQLRTEGAATRAAPDSSDSRSIASEGKLGEQLYQQNCASCHQADGKGLPGVFPPLAGSETVEAADPSAHIRTILFGLQGVKIDGVEYSAAMPAFGERFTDEEIVAIVNHERRSWGNAAERTAVTEVSELRKEGRDE